MTERGLSFEPNSESECWVKGVGLEGGGEDMMDNRLA